MKKVVVIGGGFSGMSAAAYLAKGGMEVSLIEKHSDLGGRCRQFSADGFHFDMGPSWYWMPEVFENFYQSFGFTASDFYELKRLDPSYKIVFEDDEFEVPASLEVLYDKFEELEPGSSQKLKKFLASAKYKYDAGMNEYVFKPGDSLLEYLDLKVLKSFLKLNMLNSLSSEVRSLFKNPKLIQLLEFPVLFLGDTAQKIPALYSLMNYADLSLGTWYPLGGMAKISEAFEAILKSQNVKIHRGQEVKKVDIRNKGITAVKTEEAEFEADYVVCAADYHHFDQNILPPEFRMYTPSYWSKRKMAPSSLLFYIGLDSEVPHFLHHNLFFDADFGRHADQIYSNPKWPDDPLFYICCPSKTDSSVAPAGMENIFILVPLAAGIEDSEIEKDKIFELISERIKNKFSFDITQKLVYKRSFCVNEFKSEYNSFKGNAYGLSNTLMQTGFLKPKIRSRKLNNLYNVGQLTSPGPGVPPSIISGEVASRMILRKL